MLYNLQSRPYGKRIISRNVISTAVWEKLCPYSSPTRKYNELPARVMSGVGWPVGGEVGQGVVQGGT